MRHSCRYLLEDDRRSFSTIVAIALGERAAMIIQEIHHWASEHFRAKDKRYLYDGAYWIWNSYKQWKKTFPFIPEPSLKKIILGLESQGILVSGEFNKNRGDRTKWYRINYDLLEQTLLPAEAEYNRICEEALDRKQPPSDLMQPPLDLMQPPLDLLQPPLDLGDPLCTTDLSTDLSTDQTKNKRADDFFVNPSSTQIQENLPPAQTKNPNIQDPQTPKPLSPALPENIGKVIAPSIAVSKQAEKYMQFEKRFSQPKPQNRHAPQSVVDAGYAEWHNGKHPNDWRKSLIDVCVRRKKERQDKATVGAATDFIFNTIKDCVALGFWGKFQELVDQALELEAADRIATQQRQTEQQRFEQPPEGDGERVDVNKVLADLKRKKLLRNSQAA